MRTYVRSLCFILAKAVDDLLPNAEMYIEHAVAKGYYFQIEAGVPVGKPELTMLYVKDAGDSGGRYPPLCSGGEGDA